MTLWAMCRVVNGDGITMVDSSLQRHGIQNELAPTCDPREYKDDWKYGATERVISTQI